LKENTMSRYTVNSLSVTIDPRRAALEALTSAYFSMPCLSSAQLEDTTSMLAAVTPIDRLERRWQRLEALPGAADILDRGSADLLDKARRLTIESTAAAGLGDSAQANLLATRADTLLRAAVTDTVTLLRRDERRLVVAATTSALHSLGYTLTQAEGRRTTGLWAERGHEVIAVLAPETGGLEIDVAGLSGTACSVPIQQLENTLRELGVETSAHRRSDHGDETGGNLIRRAGLAAPDDLARGLVVQHEDGLPKSRSAQPVATQVPRQRLSGTR
jgi:hypothetical protein